MYDGSRNHQGLQSDFWLNFKRSRNAVIGSIIVTIVLLIAVLGPTVAPFDSASTDMFATWATPGGKHLLGADGLGRDILSRILVGTRVSLTVALVVLAITLVVGTSLGMVAGYIGGWLDDLIMRFVDIVFAFPELILAILVASVMGPPAETEEVDSDYREVGGVKVPFRVVTRQGGKARVTLTASEVKINPGAPESVYKKP